ncbi:MAG: porin [Glaciimonas sp.]|nr:porin [Glaciimonas sp.]
MKKSLIALAVLASVAGVAQAQSAVTIYGKLDLGITKLTGDTTALGLNNGAQMQANHASRIGFKGAEDLGGGLSAIFQVENRFNADTGTQAGNSLFSGPVFVGLAGGFGTVKMGRNWSTIDSVSTAAIDPFEGDGIAGLNVVTRARINNTVTYYTPEMSGFGGQAQYIMGEKPAGAIASGTDNDGYAVGVNYNNGPIYLGAGYGVEENTDKSNIWAVSGSYAFGPAKIALGYDQRENKAIGGIRTPGLPKAKNWVVAGTYEVGAGLIKAAYNRTKDGADNTLNGVPGPVFIGGTFDKIEKLSIGYQHNLSKRTSLYADVARTKYTLTSNSNSVTGFGLGVTHNF